MKPYFKCPRLKDQHIYPNTWQKMSVSRATQASFYFIAKYSIASYLIIKIIFYAYYSFSQIVWQMDSFFIEQLMKQLN